MASNNAYFYTQVSRLSDGRVGIENSSGCAEGFARASIILDQAGEDALLEVVLPGARNLERLPELVSASKLYEGDREALARTLVAVGACPNLLAAEALLTVVWGLIESVAARRAARNLLKGDK